MGQLIRFGWRRFREQVERGHFRRDGTEKVRWPNPTSAEFVASLHPGEQAYRCRWAGCDGWHVGHPPTEIRVDTIWREETAVIELGERVMHHWNRPPKSR
jgi:hypothetical protein